MKAMLLAAGLGERMLPVTRTFPKPALPVLGRPLAVRILERLARQGVREAVVNLHHLPEVLRGLLGDGIALGLERLHYSYEETIQGTGGGPRDAATLLRGDGTLILHNADFLADVDLHAALASHRASGRPVTLVLAPPRPGYSGVEVDAGGAVISLAGRPAVEPDRVAGRYLFTGFHLIEEEILGRIPADRSRDIVRELYLALAATGEIHGYVHRGFWAEFGAPPDFLEGTLALLELGEAIRRELGGGDPVRRVGGATVAVGEGADFHAGVELRGRVALAEGVRIAEGTVVEESVVMDDARLGPGSALRRVVVGPGALVPPGTEASDALLARDDGGPLPPGAERAQGMILRRFAPGRRE
jgi:mannose-1-phosphate guanylyltransferase